ncbi:hypothetical protein BY458DRAFT_514668 [Sporodiniella umbellata]|nr:hypothetical protein BY458DRAFT_514668 [Sporodiniella umbellata]
MWRKRDVALVDMYKNNLQETTAYSKSSGNYQKRGSSIYTGDDFDVFGKEQTLSPFAALYDVEPYISTPIEEKELKISREFKRGQWEALLDSTVIIKKRKVNPIQGTTDLFSKTTSSFHTPPNIFMARHHQPLDSSIDLEYC